MVTDQRKAASCRSLQVISPSDLRFPDCLCVWRLGGKRALRMINVKRKPIAHQQLSNQKLEENPTQHHKGRSR